MDIKKIFSADRMAYLILFATIALLPIFSLPFFNLTAEMSKGFLLSIGVLSSFIFWIAGRLIEGKLSIPKSLISISGVVLAAVMSVASFFSGSISESFWGKGFELSTASIIVVCSLLLFLSSILFQDKKRIEQLVIAVFGGFVIAFLFQLAHFFLPLASIFHGYFAAPTSNLVGKWNDFAIFSGLVAILSLFLLETTPLDKRKRIALWCLLGGSLFMMLVINFLSVWIFFGLASLALFAYLISSKKQSLKTDLAAAKSFPLLPLILIICTTIFILGNGIFGSFLPAKLNVLRLEVRPSLMTTIGIIKHSLAQHPIFGFGPNRFTNAWLLFKPAEVNLSPFWNTGFNAGSGLIPSFFVMSGFAGIFAWLFFLGTIVWQFVRMRIFPAKNEDRNELLGSFLSVAFLWMMSVVYVPNIALFALAFASTGVLIAMLVQRKSISAWTYSLYGDKVKSFLSVLVMSSLLLGAIAFAYMHAKQLFANIYFSRAVSAVNDSSFDNAERLLLRSISIAANDTQYNLLSGVYVSKANELLSQKNVSIEAVKPDIQALFGSALQSNLSAIDYDKSNYLNLLSLGFFYRTVLPLGFPGAYDNAKIVYEKALALNPAAPQIYISLADLAVSNKDISGAREYINKALQLKPDYTDAYFILAKIAQDDGDSIRAISELERATAVGPTNFNAFFNIGILKYGIKEYSGAIVAFERAVLIDPANLNGHYFLGLAYDAGSRTKDALGQFELLLTQDPENQQLKEIIANIKSGKDALEKAKPAKK